MPLAGLGESTCAFSGLAAIPPSHRKTTHQRPFLSHWCAVTVKGRHIELGIDEMNLVVLLTASGRNECHCAHRLVRLISVLRRAFGNACGRSPLGTGTVSRFASWLRIAWPSEATMGAAMVVA
jgi:hypothetical protein